MADRHRQQDPKDYHVATSRSFWPDPDEYGDAKHLLAAHDRQIGDFLRASLRFLNHSPTAALEALLPHWPPPRRPGRPRRADHPTDHHARPTAGGEPT